MNGAAGGNGQPSTMRKVIATIVVVLTVAILWKVIDYRMQPPPPEPIHASR